LLVRPPAYTNGNPLGGNRQRTGQATIQRMANEVFLSYVRENATVAERLARELEDAGVRVWVDKMRLQPGDRWKSAIKAAIRGGHLFIPLFSREFRRS